MAKKGTQTQSLSFTSLITCFCKYKYVKFSESYRIIPFLESIKINTLNALYAKARDARWDSDPSSSLKAYTLTFHLVNMQIMFVELSQQMATGFGLVYDFLDITSSHLNHVEACMPPSPLPPVED